MFAVYIRVSVTRYYSGVIPKVLHEPHKPPFRKQQKNLRNGILPGIVRRDKKKISTSHFFRSFPNDARPEKKQRRGNVCIKGRIKTPNFWRRGDSSLHRQKETCTRYQNVLSKQYQVRYHCTTQVLILIVTIGIKCICHGPRVEEGVRCGPFNSRWARGPTAGARRLGQAQRL